MRITVIVPSRGRPSHVRRLWQSMRETTQIPTTQIVIAADQDDPRSGEYADIMLTPKDARFGMDIDRPAVRLLPPTKTGDMVRAMNSAIAPYLVFDELILGCVNDDMVFLTPGWDRKVLDAQAKRKGIVFGNDLFQGQDLVTSPFIHVDVLRAIGYYCLPVCRHLFVDNAWKDLGTKAKCLTYLPDVVIEHLHPFAGKAEWDKTYEEGNNQVVIDHDREAYERWKSNGGLAHDARRIGRALHHR